MRSAYLPYGMLLSIGNVAQHSAFVDNPGNRANWNRHLGQYVATAGMEAYQVIGGSKKLAETFADYFEGDAKGQLEHFSPAPDGEDELTDYLISYSNVALTGNDNDTISMHYPNGGGLYSHAENAYVYGAAIASSKMYELAGNTEKAGEMKALAEKIQEAILTELWCEQDQAFETRAVNPKEGFVVHNEEKPNLVPWKENNNFNYFSEGVVPTDEESIEKYSPMLSILSDPEQCPIWPAYTANQKDNEVAIQNGASPTNNFSNINFTLQTRAYEAALRTYDREHAYVSPEMLARMVEWQAWNMYPDAGDITYPNNNEFFNTDDDPTHQEYYRSWIYHNILGNFNYVFIEDMAGMRARSDDVLELDPIDFGYDHFMVNNLKYHGKDVSIVWQDPANAEKAYPEAETGFSLYVDHKLVMNSDKLAHIVYDPDKNQFTSEDEDVTFSVNKSVSLAAAEDVILKEDRVVNMMEKSGLVQDGDGAIRKNLAEGAQAEASFTAEARDANWNRHFEGSPGRTHVNEITPDPLAVTDGMTVNMPFWGNYGSPNSTDSLTLKLEQAKEIDRMNLYFFNDRQSDGYAAPAKYMVEYKSGGNWRHMENQTRTPGAPDDNYNQILFDPVTTDEVRVTFQNAPGHSTAVTEIQLYNDGGERSNVENQAPKVTLLADYSKASDLKLDLIGTVSDDGMPYDQPAATFEWSVIKKPGEGSRVYFSDEDTLTPSISCSDSGEYTVRLTADDGEKTTEREITVTITRSETREDVDIAPKGTIDAYPKMYGGLENVNNPDNQPKGTYADAAWDGFWYDIYNGWKPDGSNTKSNTSWLSCTWSDPVNVSKADIYWLTKDTWTMLPKDFTIQYKGEDGNWHDVSLQTDTKQALKTGQYNTVEFSPVLTTALRVLATITQPSGGIGVARWKIYTTRVESVDPVFVKTGVNEEPDLPETVEVTLSDGSKMEMDVDWDDIPEEKLEHDGEFELGGINQEMATFFHATVYVRSQTQVTVNSVEPVHVTIKPGEMPRLPSTVKVQYNNGAYDNVHTQVEWGEIPEEYLTEPGTYTLTDLGALIVKENVLANDKAATLILKVTGALKITVENGTADQESAEAGETVTITANPAPEGKVFDKWISEDGVVFADASKAATTFQMPDHPVTVTAVYRDEGSDTFSITVKNGIADKISAKTGETVTITANPAPTGKTFDKWTSEDGIVFADASKAATTFQMPDQPVTVTAVYRSKGGSTSDDDDDDDDDRSGSSKPLPTSPTDPGLGRVWNGEVGPTGGALYLDTKSYSMAPGNIYDIKAVLKGYPISSLKVYSSRSGIARVELLPSGNYRVTGLQSGTTYIMFEAFGTDGSLLNHASVKVDVAPGVIQGGVRNAAASLF